MSRRAFTAELDREIDRRKLQNRPSVLAILDLDHFKSINDSFGHPIGDRVLKAVARTCIAAMRPDDILGRLGGEEFAILLPDILTGAALRVANRIRTAIADLVVDAGLPLTITASFGVAPLNDSITSAAEWLSRADDPLYVAKRNGRNCCATTDDATTLHNAMAARA